MGKSAKKSAKKTLVVAVETVIACGVIHAKGTVVEAKFFADGDASFDEMIDRGLLKYVD